MVCDVSDDVKERAKQKDVSTARGKRERWLNLKTDSCRVVFLIIMNFFIALLCFYSLLLHILCYTLLYAIYYSYNKELECECEQRYKECFQNDDRLIYHVKTQ